MLPREQKSNVTSLSYLKPYPFLEILANPSHCRIVDYFSERPISVVKMPSLDLEVVSTGSPGYSTDLPSELGTEPPLCDDIDCTYPFGSVCKVCYFRISIKEEEFNVRGYWKRVEEWIEDINLEKHPASFNRQTSVNRADEIESNVDGYEAKTSNSIQHLSTPKQKTEPKTEEKQERFCPPPICTYAPSSCPLSIPTSSPRTLPLFTPIPHNISPWLNTLFDSNLAGHISGTGFVGGTTDKKGIDNPCPFCFQPSGDPRLQHFERRKYAHEEREREERVLWYHP